MRIDLEPESGGVLIEGTDDELDGLRQTIEQALWAEEGEVAEGAILTDEGVETVTIRRLPEEAQDDG